MIVAIGLPLLHDNGLFNAACLAVDGRIAGFAANQKIASPGGTAERAAATLQSRRNCGATNSVGFAHGYCCCSPFRGVCRKR